MSRRKPRRNHAAACKAKVALEGLHDVQAMAAIAQKHSEGTRAALCAAPRQAVSTCSHPTDGYVLRL